MPFLRRLFFAAALAAAVVGGGCSYKREIQQGNNALRANLDQLQAGMTRDEIVRLLGPPQGDLLFRESRWLYAYKLRASGFADNPLWLTVELLFDDDGRLVEKRELRNDYKTEDEKEDAAKE